MPELKPDSDFYYFPADWEYTMPDLYLVADDLQNADGPQEVAMLKKDGSFWGFSDPDTREMRAFTTEEEAGKAGLELVRN